MSHVFASSPKFFSVSDLQRKYAFLLKRLKKNREPLLILKKNKLEAVLLSPTLFTNLTQKVRQYEETKLLEALDTYRREKKARKLKRLEKLTEIF